MSTHGRDFALLAFRHRPVDGNDTIYTTIDVLLTVFHKRELTVAQIER